MAAEDRNDEDLALVHDALARREGAFAALYEKYRERVYRVAYHFVHNKPDALDLCQETFVRVFQSLRSFQGRSRFSTWLMRIASNTCIDSYRHKKVRRAGELDEQFVTGDLRNPGAAQTPNPARNLERQELRGQLDAAIDELSPDHRAVFVFHAVDGLTYQEIAETVGVPIGTVMSRLHYARKRLQGLLAELKKG
ncbi:sigma-70 family RNA polymerase sigma factor [bacterium]|nr:sigma-70 family RNA polymerase sigma factor [bacterium]